MLDRLMRRQGTAEVIERQPSTALEIAHGYTIPDHLNYEELWRLTRTDPAEAERRKVKRFTDIMVGSVVNHKPINFDGSDSMPHMASCLLVAKLAAGSTAPFSYGPSFMVGENCTLYSSHAPTVNQWVIPEDSIAYLSVRSTGDTLLDSAVRIEPVNHFGMTDISPPLSPAELRERGANPDQPNHSFWPGYGRSYNSYDLFNVNRDF